MVPIFGPPCMNIHSRTHGHPKTDCLRHRSNDGGGIKSRLWTLITAE